MSCYMHCDFGINNSCQLSASTSALSPSHYHYHQRLSSYYHVVSAASHLPDSDLSPTVMQKTDSCGLRLIYSRCITWSPLTQLLCDPKKFSFTKKYNIQLITRNKLFIVK